MCMHPSESPGTTVITDYEPSCSAGNQTWVFCKNSHCYQQWVSSPTTPVALTKDPGSVASPIWQLTTIQFYGIWCPLASLSAYTYMVHINTHIQKHTHTIKRNFKKTKAEIPDHMFCRWYMHIHAKRTTKSHFVTPTQHHSLSSAMMQREGRNYKSEIRTPLFSPPGNLKFWIRMTHCRKPFHCLETEVYKGGGTSPSKPEEPVLVDKDCFCPEHVYTNFPVIIHISQQFAWHSYAIWNYK